MKSILLLFLFSTGLNDYQKSNTYIPKENKPKWLLTGFPADNRAKNVIAKMYGFQYYSVGGCVVSKKLRDSVNRVNKFTNEMLIKKFGKKWRLKFEERVEYIEQKMRAHYYSIPSIFFTNSSNSLTLFSSSGSLRTSACVRRLDV